MMLIVIANIKGEKVKRTIIAVSLLVLYKHIMFCYEMSSNRM